MKIIIAKVTKVLVIKIGFLLRIIFFYSYSEKDEDKVAIINI